MRWNALAASQRCEVPRVPFDVRQGGRALRTGSVACAHLQALARWPEALRVDDAGVTMTLPAPEREAFFAQANRALRDAGLIVAWRDETYPVLAQDTRELLATFERAAARFWGTITFGAHCNGYVAAGDGRPDALWIARRSDRKATDPGLLDNLIGGGVPHGQTPRETVLREGWEEAGLQASQMRGLKPGRILRLARDIPEGFMLEWLSTYDLALPQDVQPANQDGEVQSLQRLPVAEALALAAGDEMTVDASMVMLDFALRHRLLDDAAHAALEPACSPLWIGTAQ
jgi:8-oxo-dGTP pyrophosphatase MutT (NUDIX family)